MGIDEDRRRSGQRKHMSTTGIRRTTECIVFDSVVVLGKRSGRSDQQSATERGLFVFVKTSGGREI